MQKAGSFFFLSFGRLRPLGLHCHVFFPLILHGPPHALAKAPGHALYPHRRQLRVLTHVSVQFFVCARWSTTCSRPHRPGSADARRHKPRCWPWRPGRAPTWAPSSSSSSSTCSLRGTAPHHPPRPTTGRSSRGTCRRPHRASRARSERRCVRRPAGLGRRSSRTSPTALTRCGGRSTPTTRPTNCSR